MPISLPPEILVRVAQNVIQPRVPIQGKEKELEDQIRLEQSTLRALMQTCRLLHNVAEDELYRHCVSGNTGRFLEAVKPGPPYHKIERLQLYHPTRIFDIQYPDILRDVGWSRMAPKRGPRDGISVQIAESSKEEGITILDGGDELAELVFEKVPVLPNLKKVALGGVGKGAAWDEDPISIEGGPVCFALRLVPLTFLDMPQIDYLCQNQAHGPLSLPGFTIRSTGSLRVFTHHPRPFTDTLPYHTEQLPIVIGAINRYYFDKPSGVDKKYATPTLQEDYTDLLAPFLFLLHPLRAGVMTTARVQEATGQEIELLCGVDVTGTAIEIYNYIRVIDMPNKAGKSHREVGREVAEAPSYSLAAFREALDPHIHHSWRGKVSFHDREEAPPCPSCGFSLQDEFEHRSKQRQ